MRQPPPVQPNQPFTKPKSALQPTPPPPTKQVLFLLYHYYNAKEIYNAIRVFIAAYVWLTGFGARARVPLAMLVGLSFAAANVEF